MSVARVASAHFLPETRAWEYVILDEHDARYRMVLGDDVRLDDVEIIRQWRARIDANPWQRAQKSVDGWP